MMENTYHNGSHCKYLVQYHIIWCPKFRYPVLKNGRDIELKEYLKEICTQYHYDIKAMEIMPDHIHLFLDVPQTVAPCDVVRTLKSLSAVKMLQNDKDLRYFYARCGVLWSRGYFISTIGKVSEETIKKYIEEQKHAEKSSKT